MTTKKQKQWLEKGLCALCGSTKGNTGLLCSACNEKKAQYARERRQMFKQEHRCIQCGKPLPDDEPQVRCSICRKTSTKAQLEVRRNRVRRGLCACGRIPLLGKNTCEVCTLKRIAYDQTGSWKNWKAIRDMFYQQGGCCAYTGLPLRIGDNATLDHLMPKSKGGDNSLDNLHWVDMTVNRMKDTLTETEFINLIKLILERRGELTPELERVY